MRIYPLTIHLPCRPGNPFRKRSVEQLREAALAADAVDAPVTLSLEGCDAMTHAERDRLQTYGR